MSQRKIDSARINGAKSHGPITEQGRKTSSMNAVKHGLTARTVVLSNENGDEYNVLLNSYVEELQPAGPIEMDLVLEMANAKWRQRRLCKIESELFDRQMDKQKEELNEAYLSYDEVFEHTFAFQKLSESVSLQMLNRMESRLERTYSRALNNLLRLRRLRESNPGVAITKDEKRTQSQDWTPATNHQPRLVEAQHKWNPPPSEPSAPSTSSRDPDPGVT